MEWGDYIADAVHDAKRLEELRKLPLERKIQISQARIIEWYNHYHGNVVVSFSGGKDSTVLLHLVRSIFPDVKAVFSNTGLEYPEIQKHVISIDNVDIVRPTMRFDEVISTYGYPLIGKEVAEAIYYARRIRSQSGNVEREREREPDRTEKAGRAVRITKADRSRNDFENRWQTVPRRTVTQRLQIGGVADRPSESDRDSQCQTAEESSHRDKHCKEQTNRPDRADAGIRNGAGVVVNPLTIGGWNRKSIGEGSRCKGSGQASVEQKNYKYGSKGETSILREVGRLPQKMSSPGREQPRRQGSVLEQERIAIKYNSGGVQPKSRLVCIREERATETRTPRIPSRDSTNWADWRRGCL